MIEKPTGKETAGLALDRDFTKTAFSPIIGDGIRPSDPGAVYLALKDEIGTGIFLAPPAAVGSDKSERAVIVRIVMNRGQFDR